MKSFPRGSRRAQISTAIAVLSFVILSHFPGEAQSPAASDSQITRTVGTIKNNGADSITVTPDSGGELTATLTASTKILRVPPGEKDLKNATPLQAQDLQTGDRVLVRGTAIPDSHSISALAVIVMKQGDLSAKHEHDREDWQKRGVGGLVTATDAATGAITISVSGFGTTHNVAVHTTKSTIARRYASDSVKFDDAKPATLDQIKTGDQLRARGTRSTDGNEMTAEEIVFGTFRNIAGTITAVDPASNTMTVQDAIRKSAVVVKVTPDSQMRKLPPEFAQRIAMRLKASAGEGGAQGGVQNEGPQGTRPAGSDAARVGSQFPRGPGGMAGGNGPPDLQRILSRMPNSTLADLKKGDAVMIVSTMGDASSVTAITLLAGVEPILTAAPNRSMILSPWTLGGSGGEAEAAQ